ncbi:MAG: ferredoxin [Puniceicoccales bacterium]|jgi:ferredoxin|nr:ferredoxin [Puniceicoccales bacterium]
MADKNKKNKENCEGRFYVDDQCIDCDLCRDMAGEYFGRQEMDGYSYVIKQPETEEDIKLCEEAMESCPVEAIGNDGDEE